MYNIVNIYKKGIQELRISEDIKTCYTILNQYRKRNLWTLNRKVLTFAYKSIMRTKYDPNYTTNDMNLTFPLHISYSRALVHMVYISQWEWKVINVIMFLRFFFINLWNVSIFFVFNVINRYSKACTLYLGFQDSSSWYLDKIELRRTVCGRRHE